MNTYCLGPGNALARSRRFRRCRFLAAMTGGVGLMILPPARSAFAYRANERLRLAVVGMAGYGAWQEWIDACRNGQAPLANFEHAAPFAEFLAVGSLATRFPGEPIEFKPATGQITNHPRAAGHLRYEYRKVPLPAFHKRRATTASPV